MVNAPLICNERDVAKARRTLDRMAEICSGGGAIELSKAGFSDAIIQQFRTAVEAYARHLSTALRNYQTLKEGAAAELISNLADEPGSALIFARIHRGQTQAELASELGLKEQQIQRYEAERYRSISLANLRKIADALGVTFVPRLRVKPDLDNEGPSTALSDDEAKKIIKHAQKFGWPLGDLVSNDTRSRIGAIGKYIQSDQQSRALLRTGLERKNIGHTFMLLAWRKRVLEKARASNADLGKFDLLDIVWLNELVKLSSQADGPLAARSFLQEKGIQLVVEPQISGLPLDGAAFLDGGIPIVGLTLRFDRLDNFWFTLLHELAHVYLHYYLGLSAGFFDDMERNSTERLESEADKFAESVLISPERWRVSPARIAKSEEPIRRFAQNLGVHPAIVFGRIRKERNDYKQFSSSVGSGEVRRWFAEDYKDAEQ